MDFLSEYVDVGGVKEVGVDVGGGACQKMSAADGQNLAHGVAAVDDATLVHIRRPDEVILLDKLYYHDIIKNTLQQVRIFLVQPTLLPNAPQHPLMPQRREIRPDVFLVLCLRAAPCPNPRCHPADVLLHLDALVGVKTPLATQVEMLRRIPSLTK